MTSEEFSNRETKLVFDEFFGPDFEYQYQGIYSKNPQEKMPEILKDYFHRKTEGNNHSFVRDVFTRFAKNIQWDEIAKHFETANIEEHKKECRKEIEEQTKEVIEYIKKLVESEESEDHVIDHIIFHNTFLQKYKEFKKEKINNPNTQDLVSESQSVIRFTESLENNDKGNRVKDDITVPEIVSSETKKPASSSFKRRQRRKNQKKKIE